MTLEELRAEAKRQGYNLVPKPKPKEKALPCPVCGTFRMNLNLGLSIPFGSDTGPTRPTFHGMVIHDPEKDYRYVYCNKCGFEGPKAYGIRVKDQDAVKAWNEYITKGETYWDEHPEQKPE